MNEKEELERYRELYGRYKINDKFIPTSERVKSTDYYKEGRKVVDRYKKGELGAEEALDLLDKIQDKAYEKYPDEEPDGDITYCHSIHMRAILEGK